MELIVLLINLLMGFVLGYSFRAAHGCCELVFQGRKCAVQHSR
jgi:hypothetical protein